MYIDLSGDKSYNGVDWRLPVHTDVGGVMDENKNRNSNKLPKNTQTIIILVISGLLMLTLISFMNSWIKSSTTKYISYTEFVSKMEAGEIEAVRVESDRIVIVPKKQVSPMLEFTYYTGFGVDRTTLYEACEANGVQFDVPVQDSGSAILDFLLVWVLPVVQIGRASCRDRV